MCDERHPGLTEASLRIPHGPANKRGLFLRPRHTHQRPRLPGPMPTVRPAARIVAKTVS